MDVATALTTLGLDEEPDQGGLESAYAKTVRAHKPDCDPEGFKRVRAAYELLQRRLADESEAEPLPDVLVSARSERRSHEPNDALKDELRDAFRRGGFDAFRGSWERVTRSLRDERDRRRVTLFGLTLTFFHADQRWVDEMMRFVAADWSDIEDLDDELMLLDLFAGYRERRKHFLNRNVVRAALDEALVAWGDPKLRRAPTAIATWLRSIEDDVDSLLAAFPWAAAAYNLLPLIEYVCSRAPDLADRWLAMDDDELDDLVGPLIDECAAEMRAVHAGRQSAASAHRAIRQHAVALYLETPTSLSSIFDSIVRHNDPARVTTRWLRDFLEDDYALHLLDLARGFGPAEGRRP